ncbi:SURF1 family protein [Lacibacterium aquatile]|uniref:SURF1-like protein n=1 Tax=Lacibacterium aquatile TaxID=1168082 RepID=A0ABW5DXI4_9PROT
MIAFLRQTRSLGLTVAALIGVLILLTLGTWQIQRLGWKEDILNDRARAVAAPPVALPDAGVGLSGLDFRRVVVQGELLFSDEKRVTGQYLPMQNQPEKLGDHVITPLKLADGSLLLVNRGWAPREGQIRRPAGPVELVGVLRPEPEMGWMQPPNDPVKNVWFRVNLAEMTAGRSEPVRPYYLEVLDDGEKQPPIGGQTRVALPNNHLQYALTWYSLALVLIGVYAAVLRGKARDSKTGQ